MIYFDHHSTTPVAPEVLTAMLPLLQSEYFNAGSVTHEAGRRVALRIDDSVAQLASRLGAEADEIVVTSGATESNNLALFGTCMHPRQKRRKVVSLQTEHKAMLDPLRRLERHGFEVVLLPVRSRQFADAGRVDLQQLADTVDERTALVSIMLANNEIGTLQALSEIAPLCRRYDVLLHTDATQAVGRVAVNVDRLDVDLLSFSAHKFYGPKGVGGLFVRRRGRRVKLQAQIVGGGQQNNFRSGTLNTPGIIGMQTALDLCCTNNAWDQPAKLVRTSEAERIRGLRDRLYRRLANAIEGLELSGPSLDAPADSDSDIPSLSSGQTPPLRLPGNLNCSFYPVEGQSLMMSLPELAVSSGSACTSAEPGASHVLRAIGLSEEQARSSLRFGLGRYNTQAEVDQAADWIIESVDKLRRLV